MKKNDLLKLEFSKFASMTISLRRSNTITGGYGYGSGGSGGGGGTCDGSGCCKETATTNPCTYVNTGTCELCDYDPATQPDLCV
jgi:hypothetical protein